MLTEQELRHFETFGFIAMRQVFTAEELETLNPELFVKSEKSV